MSAEREAELQEELDQASEHIEELAADISELQDELADERETVRELVREVEELDDRACRAEAALEQIRDLANFA